MRRILATVVVTLALVVVLPARQAGHRFGLDDFSRVARVADPQFSPDGKSIAVVISHPNLEEDRYDPDLVIVEVASKAQKKLVTGLVGLSSPRWAPDGQQLAFLANAGPGTAAHLQVYLVALRGGQPKLLSDAPRPVQQLAWSPDSKTIAYATQDEPEKKPGFDRFNDSFEVTPNTDYTMTAPVSPTHVWVVAAAGGDPKRLTSGTWSLPISHPPGPPASAIVWTPDGTGVVFTRQVGRGAVGAAALPGAPAAVIEPIAARAGGAGAGAAGRSGAAGAAGTTIPLGQRGSGQGRGAGGGACGGLQVVNLADLSIAPLSAGGSHPQFSPDGKMVVSSAGSVCVLATATPVSAPGGDNAPAPTPAAGGGGRGGGGLTGPIDRGIARALWMPDSKSLIVGGNDTMRVSLWQQPLDGTARKLDTGDVSPNSSYFVDMAVSKDGAIAFAGTSPMRPAELYYMASPAAPVERLTDVNAEIAALPIGKTDVIEWTNDNFQENGTLTYPPDFDPSQKYPLVLYIHGGPTGASMRTFSAQAQLMAAKGWLVFQPNYRGSDNLGRQYQGAIRGDAGEGPGRDVMAGIEAVKAKGFVDETRLGVSGWSYGGYMTTWLLGHYDIWKAAVTGASVTNQLDQYNLSDSAGGGGNGSPWTNPQVMDRMRQQSPITSANKIKAPTLILHNVGDYRVTITQSYELFHALRDNGVTTQFIAYPISGHNAQDPVRQRDVQRRWLEWMATYLDAPSPAKGKGE
jgi:dipeptidyl aminopeptidase/acylaminoacyl peptidase